MVSVAAFAVTVEASPPVEAHTEISVGIGIGFPGFFAAPSYTVPVGLCPIYDSAPYVAYGQPPQCTLSPLLCATYQHCCSCYWRRDAVAPDERCFVPAFPRSVFNTLTPGIPRPS
jgi:hypothetical protein